MSTRKTKTVKNKKVSHKISKKKVGLTLSQKLSNSNYKYYLIHTNGGRAMLTLVNYKTNSLEVYKIIYNFEISNKSTKNKQSHIEVNDYTLDNSSIDEEERKFIELKPIFEIKKYEKIFIGHDIFPENTYIKNKKFGLGNSILVYDGKDYYSINFNKVTKLNKKQIKGDVIGYVSPIIGSDVSYPIIFTDTHMYAWCNDIDEYKIPNTETKKLIQMLTKLKNPNDIPKNKIKEVNAFLRKYLCQNNKIKLKEKVLVSVKY